MIAFLSSHAVRAPRRFLAAWLVVLVAGVLAAGGLFSSLDADLDPPSSFESERVSRQLAALDPDGGTIAAVVEGAPVNAAVVDGLRGLNGVDEVATVRSDDDRAVLVAVGLRGNLGDHAHDALVDDVVAQLRAIDAPTVLVGSEELLDDEVADLAESDAQRAEMISLPIALVAMVVVFGGLIAAGMPVLLALSGVSATMLALTVASSLTDISLYAVNVTLMLGIGLGIDYGLLMVSRFREERAIGRAVEQAIERTMATAGRTVVFSGLTVAAALSGLLVFADPTIRSLGIAGIAVVLACVAAALTLLPALLALAGHRIRPRRMAGSNGVFARLVRAIQRRAGFVAVGVGALLILLAVPFTQARFDDLGARQLPSSSENRRVAETIDERFTAIAAESIEVVTTADSEHPGFAPWLDQLRTLPGVVDVAVTDVSRATSIVEVHADGQANGPIAQSVVQAIRGLDAPFGVAVGGDPAEIVDHRAALSSRLPLALAIVVLATFLLLFLMTGSVVLPLKAIVMNVLSLGATFGAMVLVFQDGHLAGWLGIEAPGALDLVMPVIVFLFAFGLSMDYEVFLLSRIREAWMESGDNDTAVAVGLQRSGRIVTSAALLVVVVFAGFVAGDMVALQQLGLGMAIAVIVDATIVRCLLVPAAMKLMGSRNWWAPQPLARLYARVGLREAAVGT